MAVTDYKIDPAEVNAVHVEAQPTILKGSATQNKQAFDAYPDMITSHLNDLIDFLATDTSMVIDGSVLLLYASLGWVAP